MGSQNIVIQQQGTARNKHACAHMTLIRQSGQQVGCGSRHGEFITPKAPQSPEQNLLRFLENKKNMYFFHQSKNLEPPPCVLYTVYIKHLNISMSIMYLYYRICITFS